ncbi:HAD-like domain-containing protein [Dactylonectria estremocensis]|uniref:HAD-like domain-containing protein n=1 Tax=Dactylonectria estremocensis TaxID=1079267 RepID=A0A9P9F0Q9_9HYPO|nr:HAD-like domain-containing protein [Dactylonectria estremocensis]
MSDKSKPKVLLFDIGGVCIKSPFQAILDYEIGLGIPPGWVNYSISKTSPNGFWHQIERGEISMDQSFFDGFSKDLHNSTRWEAFYKQERVKNLDLPQKIPPPPSVDAKWLFEEMMTASNHPDPWMFPALKKLKENGDFILAALSNTVIFPPGHKLHVENFGDDPVRRLFDIFISSAHVGIRKPDPKMYHFALAQINKYAADNASSPRGQQLDWSQGIRSQDILFLDDIGENLKEARKQGFGTIKVNLGRAFEAVDELEKATGLRLAGNHPRVPEKPNYQGVKAKI